MAIHSCQVIDLNPFISSHSCQAGLFTANYLFEFLHVRPFTQIPPCQFMNFKSFISNHSFPFLHVILCTLNFLFEVIHDKLLIVFNSFQSIYFIIHFSFLISMHSVQCTNSSVSFNSFIDSFLPFFSYPLIHEFQFLHFNSFLSIIFHFHSSISIHWFQFRALNKPISCSVTDLNLFFQFTQNSCKPCPFSKLPPRPPRRVPGTTWYNFEFECIS